MPDLKPTLATAYIREDGTFCLADNGEPVPSVGVYEVPCLILPAWRPIEEYVADGKPFLGLVDGVIRLVYWGKTSHVPLYGFNLADQGAENCEPCKPTHWLPMPPNPEEPHA